MAKERDSRMVCFLGPTETCTVDSCENGGRCVQEWDTYTCDCDMTSYSGRTCGDGW
jgi:neurexin